MTTGPNSRVGSQKEVVVGKGTYQVHISLKSTLILKSNKKLFTGFRICLWMFLIWMLSSQWPRTVNSIVSIAISSSSNNVVESARQYVIEVQMGKQNFPSPKPDTRFWISLTGPIQNSCSIF